MIASGAIRYRRPIFQTLLAMADVAVVGAALAAAVAVRDRMEHAAVLAAPAPEPPSALRLLLLAAIFVSVYAAMGLYGIRRAWRSASLALCVMVASGLATALFLAACYLARDHSTSRLVLGLLWLFVSTAVWLVRIAAREAVRWCGRRGIGVKRVVVVGDNGVAEAICRLIEENPYAGLRLAGRASPREAGPGAGATLARGTLEEVAAELLDCRPHRVLFALEIAEHEELQGLAERCLARNIEVLQVPHLYHAYPGQVVFRELLGMPLLGFGNHGLDGWELLVKEVVDRSVSVALLAAFAPALVLLAAAVRWSTGGPAIRRERRAGRGGVCFTLLSFETGGRRGPGPVATKLGSFMLALGLERLPHLINVARGQMSLVGPTADTPEGLRRLNDWQRSRLSVKPGITGLAQIRRRGPGGDPSAMVRDDLRYIESQSFLLDLGILTKTAWLVAVRALQAMPPGGRARGSARAATIPPRAPLPNTLLGRSDGAAR